MSKFILTETLVIIFHTASECSVPTRGALQFGGGNKMHSHLVLVVLVIGPS